MKLQVRAAAEHFSSHAKKPVPGAPKSPDSGFSRYFDLFVNLNLKSYFVFLILIIFISSSLF